MKRFDRVKEILDASVGGQSIGAHGAFWRTLTLQQFKTKRVFGLNIVSPGNGETSNLVLALKGAAPFGSDIGVEGATFPRMPVGFDPVPADNIFFIQTWIADGCPYDELNAAPAAE